MATCNDCIHYEACRNLLEIFAPQYKGKNLVFESLCKHFKDKSDVAEVVHGELENLKYLGDCLNPCQHTCGACGKSYFDDNHNNYPYCPMCGAKMDGRKV